MKRRNVENALIDWLAKIALLLVEAAVVMLGFKAIHRSAHHIPAMGFIACVGVIAIARVIRFTGVPIASRP